MKTQLKLGTAHRPVRAIGTLDTSNQRPVLSWAQPVSEEGISKGTRWEHNMAIEPEKRWQGNVGARGHSWGDLKKRAPL